VSRFDFLNVDVFFSVSGFCTNPILKFCIIVISGRNIYKFSRRSWPQRVYNKY